MKSIEELQRRVDLAPLHRILLTNTGSMTSLLEALFGDIRLKTEVQKVIKAKPEVAQLLRIDAGGEVNYRVVTILAHRPLVHATSYSPISRLASSFREDLMKQDIPIGRILSSHSLETRKEIIGFDTSMADERFSSIFKIPHDAVLLKRDYNIIHKGRILINISEVFPYEIVRWAG